MQISKTTEWENVDLHKIFIIAVLCAAVLFWISLFFYHIQSQYISSKSKMLATRDIYSGIISTNINSKNIFKQEVPILKATSLLEVNISNNGLVFLRGAKVTSMSGDIINIVTSWNSLDLNWSVKLRSTTKFMNSNGGIINKAEIKAGDIVNISGKLIKGGGNPQIEGEYIREYKS